MNPVPPNPSGTPPRHRRSTVATTGIVITLALLLGAAYFWLHRNSQDDALLRSEGSALQANAELLAYASQRALPLYQEHCASCHGADLNGSPSHLPGIANLGDAVWLYGTGQITDIEQTILYGIRSGHPKSHNLAEMPGFGRIGQLSKDEVNDVVEYMLQISHQPHDAAAAERGKVVYQNQGLCYDCHAADGYGVSDYGTPSLTGRGGSWLYGGDRATLHKSTFDGRRGLCPAWVNKLSFAEIRALAAFLYSKSHDAAAREAAGASSTPAPAGAAASTSATSTKAGA